MKTASRTLSTLLAFMGLTGFLYSQINFNPNSDPKEAREDARKIAVKFRDRGYSISPIANGDNFTSQTVFDMELTKGLDCVIILAQQETGLSQTEPGHHRFFFDLAGLEKGDSGLLIFFSLNF